MRRWPIERSWTLLDHKAGHEGVRSRDLLDYGALAMLGAAGLGKTCELNYLADLDRQRGLDVRSERLAVLGQTADGLAARLASLAASATDRTVIYLDALDEVMIPVRCAGLVLERWVAESLSANRPRLHISCRSAVWPPSVWDAMRQVYGEEGCTFALLQPLSRDDIKTIASDCSVDAEAFVAAVDTAGTFVLAQQPLTLNMLLEVFAAHGTLPTSRKSLFAQGVERLASEREERLHDGTAVDFSVAEVLEAAERLACFTTLSGRSVVDLHDVPAASSIGYRELEGLPNGNRPLTFDLIRAVGRSGLCERDGPLQFRFAHRQFSEYLAGRRLAQVLPHQARSLLSGSLGWPTGVAGPLRETAAFAAMENDQIAEWVTDRDPEVVGLSVVADDSLRRRATANLLTKFRKRELTDAQIGCRDGIQLAGFRYSGAEHDLRDVLRERTAGCEDVLECAIEMIESWNLLSLSEDLADLMLDAAAPLPVRKASGYALLKIGMKDSAPEASATRRRSPRRPRFRSERLGAAMQPDNLTVPALLSALTPPRMSNYYGGYAGFLRNLDCEQFDARGHIPAGLAWARDVVQRGGEGDLRMPLARRIALAAIDEIECAGVAESLAALLLESVTAYGRSPLSTLGSSSETDDAEEHGRPPILKSRQASRRRLIDALAASASESSGLWHAARETPGLLVLDDFPWLLERSVTTSFPMQQRVNYAELARMLPWFDAPSCIEAWLRLRDLEPVTSRLSFPLSIDITSDDADRARKAYAEANRRCKRPQPKKLRPPPGERVEQVLTLGEKKSPAFFNNLCRELTLKEDSTHYGMPSRFLSTTPGWNAALAATRSRIVESAKRFLTADTDEPDAFGSCPSIACPRATWLHCGLYWRMSGRGLRHCPTVGGNVGRGTFYENCAQT